MTIRAIVNSMFTANDYYSNCASHNTEVFTRPELAINKNITVKSSYYATGDYGDTLAARVAPNILDGDTLIMFFSSNTDHSLPHQFKTILGTTDTSKTMHLRCGYKIWHQSDKLRFPMKLHDEAFICLITISGSRYIFDSRGRVNRGCSVGSEICTPRVDTHKDGCIISCFSYDDPNPMAIKDQRTLASMECCGRGLAVGISPTSGGLSKRMKCVSESMCGGGDDIAFCLSLY